MAAVIPILVGYLLLAAPLVGAAPDDGGAVERAVALAREVAGVEVDPSQVLLVARQDFTLAPGAQGFRARLDLVNGELSVGPVLSPMEEASSDAGCVLPAGGAGWAVEPLGVGGKMSGCSYEVLEGIPEKQDLVCLAQPAISTAFCGITILHPDPWRGTIDTVFLCSYTGAALAEDDYANGVSLLLAPMGSCWSARYCWGCVGLPFVALVEGTEGTHVAGLLKYD